MYIFIGKWKCIVFYYKFFLIGYEVMNVLRFVLLSVVIVLEKLRNSVWFVSVWICWCVMIIKLVISLYVRRSLVDVFMYIYVWVFFKMFWWIYGVVEEV